MKHIKSVFAAVLAVSILIAVLPFAFPVKASAVNGVQKKLDELRAVYDVGTFFTVSGEACDSNQCDDCRLSLIPSRGGLPSGAEVCAAGSDAESWSCRSFANYAFYYLFGEWYWHLDPVETPVLGDFIKLNDGRHSAIYLWEDANYYYVYDSNGDSRNGVCYNRAFSKARWSLSGIYHAASYDEVMRSGESVVYHELEAGRYGVYSVVSGLYLGRAEAEDENALFTLTSEHDKLLTALTEATDYGTMVTIAANENEKTRWMPEAVAGGYVIRSETEPEKVLTAKDGSVVLAEYTGSAAQVWSFGPTAHSFEEETVSESTCTVNGQKILRCADCGYTCVELQPLEPHIYTVETIEPGENSYGFEKYKCVNCGHVLRMNVKEKLNADALIDTGDIVQKEDGYVYVAAGVTEEALFDAFPGYQYSDATATDGEQLVPIPEETVPEDAAENIPEDAAEDVTVDAAEDVTMDMPENDPQKQVLTLLVPGDVDGDGSVTTMDARLVLRYCVSMDATMSERGMLAADIDFDGKVTSQDSRWILRTAVGYDSGATTLAGLDP